MVLLVFMWTLTSVLRLGEGDHHRAAAYHVVSVFVGMGAVVADHGDPTEGPPGLLAPNPAVGGHIVKQTHVVVAVRRQTGEGRGDNIRQFVANRFQLCLLIVIAVSKFELPGPIYSRISAELAHIDIHAPAAPKCVAGSLEAGVQSLAGTGLLLVCSTHPLRLCPVPRGLGGDDIVSGVRQICWDAVPLDEAYSNPGILALVAIPVLHNDAVLLLLVASSHNLKIMGINICKVITAIAVPLSHLLLLHHRNLTHLAIGHPSLVTPSLPVNLTFSILSSEWSTTPSLVSNKFLNN